MSIFKELQSARVHLDNLEAMLSKWICNKTLKDENGDIVFIKGKIYYRELKSTRFALKDEKGEYHVVDKWSKYFSNEYI